MNDPKSGKNPSATNPSAPPADAQGSTARLAILLAVLGIGLVMLGYDWMVLTPACAANYKKLEALVEEKNRQGVKTTDEGTAKTSANDFLVTDKDVHGLLGKPTKTVDKSHYFEEWYCGWGAIPIRRNYIVVAYQKGKDGGPNRHHSHYMNNIVEDPPVDPSKTVPAKVDPNAKMMPSPDGPSSLPPTRPGVEPTEGDKPATTEEGTKKPSDEPKPDDSKPEEPKKEEPKPDDSKPEDKTPAAKTEEGETPSESK